MLNYCVYQIRVRSGGITRDEARRRQDGRIGKFAEDLVKKLQDNKTAEQ